MHYEYLSDVSPNFTGGADGSGSGRSRNLRPAEPTNHMCEWAKGGPTPWVIDRKRIARRRSGLLIVKLEEVSLGPACRATPPHTMLLIIPVAM